MSEHMKMCVESYCATVALWSATVPSGQYAKYHGNSSQAICSVDANLATQNEDGWTTIIGKQKRMDPRVWIKKKGTKESMTEMKVQWDSSVVPRIYMIEKEEKLRRLYKNGNDSAKPMG
jgi:hypothetical protein